MDIRSFLTSVDKDILFGLFERRLAIMWLDMEVVTELRQVLVFYLGYFKHASIYNLVYSLFDPMPGCGNISVMKTASSPSVSGNRGHFSPSTAAGVVPSVEAGWHPCCLVWVEAM